MLYHVDIGSGPPVLLVHGSPVSSHSFRHQVTALSQRFRVIAPDLLGFGMSEGPLAGASFPSQADALAQLLEQLSLRSYRLVAHDWGGPIALGTAIRRGDQIVRLVLINTTFVSDFRPPWYWSPFVGTSLGDLLVDRLNLVRWLLPHLMKAARSRDLTRVYAGPLGQRSTRRTILALERLAGYRELMEEVEAALGRLRVPTLLLWGHPDIYFRQRELDRLTALLPWAEVRELTGAGHFPQEDAPEAVSAALSQFLP